MSLTISPLQKPKKKKKNSNVWSEHIQTQEEIYPVDDNVPKIFLVGCVSALTNIDF